MTTRCRQSQPRSGLETNLFGVCAAIVLAAPAILAPSPVTAAPITYTFSPPIMGPVPGGTDTISGTFTFDQTGSEFGDATLISANITVTGPLNPGTYTPLPPPFDEPPNEIDLVSGVRATMTIMFANDLGLAPDIVTSVIFDAPNLVIITPTQGTAVPQAAAAPEPTSLALLGGALGLFLLRRRSGRRHTG